MNNENEFSHRFWYWRGASGRRYIHTVYTTEACPILPGAVYVAVRRGPCGLREAVGTGRMTLFGTISACMTADELHVHLLASSEAEAEAVLADIRAALALTPTANRGNSNLFHEDGGAFAGCAVA